MDEGIVKRMRLRILAMVAMVTVGQWVLYRMHKVERCMSWCYQVISTKARRHD